MVGNLFARILILILSLLVIKSLWFQRIV